MELVENAYVSDFTKKTLEQFGWRNNDAIPAELGSLMLKIKDALPPSSRVDVLIDKDAMKDEDVENIKNMLREAKEAAKQRDQKEQFEQETENMSESVRTMYSQLQDDGPEIIDDRETAQPAEEPDSDPAADSPPPPAETVEPPETGIVPPMAILPFCPRCGWDMQQKYDVEVTDRDKEDFLVTILGGSRFTREFELMGGKMILKFRSMLADENFAVQRQLLLDQNDGLIMSEAEWFLRLFEYRMACSLAAVYDANKKPIVVVPELGEFTVEKSAEKPGQTALPAARDFVHTKALVHEVTRRLAATHLRRFQRLVEAMEAMALEPSFWNGIG